MATFRIGTARGIGYQQLTVELVEGNAPGGRACLCPSPYSPNATEAGLRNLALMMKNLGVEMHACDELPDKFASFDVVVIMEAALRSAADNGNLGRISRYVKGGRRLVLLASLFERGTVEWANRITAEYGLFFQDKEYEEVVCTGPFVQRHALTRGIQKLRWFRATPIEALPPARVLVQNPNNRSEGFLGCSGPNGNLFAVGASSLEELLLTVWPFDNARLFANLVGPAGRV